MPTLIVDATAVRQRITGIERYTREITLHLALWAHATGAKVLLLLAKDADWIEPGACDVLHSPYRSRLITEQVWIPAVCARHANGTVFFPAFPPSPLLFLLGRRLRVVRTVYDAVMWLRPETLSIRNKLYMRPLETIGMRYYDLVHTISEFSKSELSRVFPQACPKIVNSGIGVDIDRFAGATEQERSRVREVYTLPQEFFLFVGTLEPRKNLPFLVEAFSRVASRLPRTDLLLVGREGWGAEEVYDAIRRHGVSDRVKVLGSVSDQDLPVIYSAAMALVFPSTYEGFGLPIVEAMAAGTPVIASDCASMPEVAGDAALLTKPGDLAAWVAALETVSRDEDLRNGLRQRGLVRARDFSWSSVAERVIANTVRIGKAHAAGDEE